MKRKKTKSKTTVAARYHYRNSYHLTTKAERYFMAGDIRTETIQRTFCIGYATAAALLDLFHRAKLVGRPSRKLVPIPFADPEVRVRLS